MTEPVAQVSRNIEAPAADVWDALTSAEKASTFFMGATADSDFEVGSPITFEGQHEGKSFSDKGEVLEAEPGKRLKFSHWSAMSGAPDTPEHYHTVSFDLEPQGEKTRVTLTQANLQGGVTEADREHRARFEKNWQTVLDGLSKAVGH